MGGGAEFGVPVAGPVPCSHLSFTSLPYVPAMSESSTGGSYGKAGFTRRRFIIGTAGVSAVAALGGTVVRAPRAVADGAPSGPPTTTPEQLLLTWGGDPATEVTVSWSAPGTVAQPAPTLAVSAHPITAHNPGRLVK